MRRFIPYHISVTQYMDTYVRKPFVLRKRLGAVSGVYLNTDGNHFDEMTAFYRTSTALVQKYHKERYFEAAFRGTWYCNWKGRWRIQFWNLLEKGEIRIKPVSKR